MYSRFTKEAIFFRKWFELVIFVIFQREVVFLFTAKSIYRWITNRLRNAIKIKTLLRYEKSKGI